MATRRARRDTSAAARVNGNHGRMRARADELAGAEVPATDEPRRLDPRVVEERDLARHRDRVAARHRQRDQRVTDRGRGPHPHAPPRHGQRSDRARMADIERRRGRAVLGALMQRGTDVGPHRMGDPAVVARVPRAPSGLGHAPHEIDVLPDAHEVVEPADRTDGLGPAQDRGGGDVADTRTGLHRAGTWPEVQRRSNRLVALPRGRVARHRRRRHPRRDETHLVVGEEAHEPRQPVLADLHVGVDERHQRGAHLGQAAVAGEGRAAVVVDPDAPAPDAPRPRARRRSRRGSRRPRRSPRRDGRTSRWRADRHRARRPDRGPAPRS